MASAAIAAEPEAAEAAEAAPPPLALLLPLLGVGVQGETEKGAPARKGRESKKRKSSSTSRSSALVRSVAVGWKVSGWGFRRGGGEEG
jgi:hypothetical protein